MYNEFDSSGLQCKCKKCGEMCNPATMTGSRLDTICYDCLSGNDPISEERRITLLKRQIFFEIMGAPNIVSENGKIGANVFEADDLKERIQRYKEELKARGLDND